MLYQINDLRVAVETAKRLLMKEQIDKQKTGQLSVSPFMKTSLQNSKKSEKGVTFCAMEIIKRDGNSIDKLTSLMNMLDMKLDKREAQYRPKIFQNRGQRQDRYRSRNRSYSRQCGQYNNNNRGRRGNYNNSYNNRNYRPSSIHPFLT